MRPTKTILGNKAREAVLKGVNAIYEPVRRTLGPEGKNALLYRTFNRGNRITNDGHTVADCQEPKDQFIRMAAETFKESCKRTNEKVGDGTTTTVVIGGRLFNDVYNLLSEGQTELLAKSSGKIGVMSLKKKIIDTANKVKEEILKSAVKIKSLEELEKIAIVSVEDEELGKIVAKMAWECGVDGFIDVIEGYKGEIETEVIKGMRFPAKIADKAFVTNPEKYEMIVNDCPVLITNHSMDNVGDFGKAFQEINAKKTSKLIVIAPKFSVNVLQNFFNASKNGFFIYPVLTPSLRTEQFEDLSVYCGAKFIDKNKGMVMRNIGVDKLGFLEKLIVKDTELREDAVAVGGAGEKDINPMDEERIGIEAEEKSDKTAIQERIEMLKSQLLETKQEEFKKLLERRIASMGSAVGVIRVGDSTQASSLYRKLKIEDAVYACKAALRGGYVKGGGLCLKDIADTLPDDDILKAAISEPYNQIQSSVDGGIEITDDIIDPAESVYYAVEHAVGVVANLATVDIITPEWEDPALGEGEMTIARMIGEYVISDKIHKGQLKEAETDILREQMFGNLTEDEWLTLNRE